MSLDGSQKKKILLAEDDDSMRRFVEIILRKANYEVVAAEDGLIAMKNAFAQEFDAVVADALMPNLTGHDLCRMLRQNPQTKEIPCIILSGFEQEALDSNVPANAFLLKGTNLKDELLNALDKVLTEKSKV